MILFVVLLSAFTLVLIVEDIRWFEINYGALSIVALNGFFLNVLLGLSAIDMLGGAFAWVISALVIRFVNGANALGQGDIWLMGAIGLLAGAGGSFAALSTYGILMVVTHLSYKRARFRAKGKRIITLFPAALPGGLTILLLFCCRVSGIDTSFGMADDVLFRFDLTLRESVDHVGGPIAVVSAILGVAWTIFDRYSLQSERST